MDKFMLQLTTTKQTPGTGSSTNSSDQQTLVTSSGGSHVMSSNFQINSTPIVNLMNYQMAECSNSYQGTSNGPLSNAVPYTFIAANSPSNFLPNSEMNDDSETKLKEARKKGRPPKAENHSVEGFCCNICNKIFSNSSSLAKHRVTHSEERKFVCPECLKTFKRQDHLTGHMLTHSDTKPFTCDKCDKSYCDARSLKRHQEQCHPVDPNDNPILENQSQQPYFDDQPVGSVAPDSSGHFVADEGMEEANNDSPTSRLTNSPSHLHLCRTCGRSFKTSQSLNGHMRLHGGNVIVKKDEDFSIKCPTNEVDLKSTTSSLQLQNTVFQNSQLMTNAPLLIANIPQGMLSNLLNKEHSNTTFITATNESKTQLADHGMKQHLVEQKQSNVDNVSTDVANPASVGIDPHTQILFTSSHSSPQFLLKTPGVVSLSSSLVPNVPISKALPVQSGSNMMLLDNSCSSQLQALVIQHQLQQLNQSQQSSVLRVPGYNQQLPNIFGSQSNQQIGQMDFNVDATPNQKPLSATDLSNKTSKNYSLLHSLLIQTSEQPQLLQHNQGKQQQQLLQHNQGKQQQLLQHNQGKQQQLLQHNQGLPQQQQPNVASNNAISSNNSVLFQLPPSVYRMDNSNNILISTANRGQSDEPIENYAEDMNFEGFNLESDGIETFLGCGNSGIPDDHGAKESRSKDGDSESATEDDGGIENSIPEDLRSIPTHALQMFSLSSSSRNSTPPPLLDSLGNEAMSDDLLSSHGFPEERMVLSRYNDHEDAGSGVLVVEEMTYGAGGTNTNRWTSSTAVISNQERFNIQNAANNEDEKPHKSDVFDSKEPTSSFINARQVGYDRKSDLATGGAPINPCNPSMPSPSIEKTEKFRNPSLLKMKRRNWPGPLIIPKSNPSSTANQPCYGSQVGNNSSGSSNFAFQSRLRSPRIIPGSGSFDSTVPPPFNLPFVPYTPPPMLSPVRSGSGLFCLIQAALATQTPPGIKLKKVSGSGTPDLFEGFIEEVVAEESVSEEPPATDIKPHINEGPEYQAEIPDLDSSRENAFKVADHAEIVWNPSIMQNVSEQEVRIFMDFSSCAAVPFNGCNKEFAHHALFRYGGDIKRACLTIMERRPLLPPNHFMDSYKYSETSVWNTNEIERFSQSLLKNSKDFFVVSTEVETKSCKECIEFYYLWKKVCADENRKLKVMRRRQDIIYNNLRSKSLPLSDNNNSDFELQEQCLPPQHIPNTLERQQLMTSSDIQSFPFPVLPMQMTLQQQQSSATPAPAPKRPGRHPKVGGRSAKPRTKPHVSPTVLNPDVNTVFPCKVCKKVFYKVKSRSAHMKTHRVQPNMKKLPPSPPYLYNYHQSSSFFPQSFSSSSSSNLEACRNSPKGNAGNDYRT